MIGINDEIIVVAEAMAYEYLVNFFRAELPTTPVLCLIRGISWEDLSEVVKLLVDVLEKDPIGEITWLALCLGRVC